MSAINRGLLKNKILIQRMAKFNKDFFRLGPNT
jgi:hypothetical protein